MLFGGSDSKNLLPWVRKIPLKKGMATHHPSILARVTHGQRHSQTLQSSLPLFFYFYIGVHCELIEKRASAFVRLTCSTVPVKPVGMLTQAPQPKEVP